MLIIVFREHSEAARAAENFMFDYKKRLNREIEIIDPDSRRGQQFIETYDIVEYPTLIALSSDGSQLAKWRVNLPTIEEVSLY